MHGFPWKQKTTEKKKVEGRRLSITADKVRRVRELDDAYQKRPRGLDKTAHYDCWSFIAEIYPEVRVGQWRLRFPGALEAEVVEVVESI